MCFNLTNCCVAFKYCCLLLTGSYLGSHTRDSCADSCCYHNNWDKNGRFGMPRLHWRDSVEPGQSQTKEMPHSSWLSRYVSICFTGCCLILESTIVGTSEIWIPLELSFTTEKGAVPKTFRPRWCFQ